jgi:hypothetical protein
MLWVRIQRPRKNKDIRDTARSGQNYLVLKSKILRMQTNLENFRRNFRFLRNLPIASYPFFFTSGI